jgi:hypothetical protein
VSVSNIDGSFEVTSASGDVSLQVNKLAVSSKSTAHAPLGSVTGLIDPEVVHAPPSLSPG